MYRKLHEVALTGDGHLGVAQSLGLGGHAAADLAGQLQQILTHLLEVGAVDVGRSVHIDGSTMLA